MFTKADVDYVTNVFNRVKLGPHTAPFLWNLESDNDSIQIDCYSIQQTAEKFVIWEEYFIGVSRWELEVPDVREVGEANSLADAVEFIAYRIMRDWVRDVMQSESDAIEQAYWFEQDVPF